MTGVPILPIGLAALVLVAAVSDVRSRTIPNWLTFGGVAAGLAANFLVHGWAGVKTGAIGLGVALLLFVPLFALRWLGGGDAKLMFAIGAFLGATGLITVFIIDAILGGIAALILMLAKGRVRRTFSNIGRMLKSLARGRAPYRDTAELEAGSAQSLGMPRAVTIALAVLVVIWASRLPVR
jgi:prepilin peptidase CpaA